MNRLMAAKATSPALAEATRYKTSSPKRNSNVPDKTRSSKCGTGTKVPGRTPRNVRYRTERRFMRHLGTFALPILFRRLLNRRLVRPNIICRGGRRFCGVCAMPRHLVDEPEFWLSRAEEVRAIADDMKEADAKAIMERIANDYERLAKNAENRRMSVLHE